MHKGVASLLTTTVFVALLVLNAGERARADGALAVGTTGDVVKDGIAFGTAIDVPKEVAAAAALARCRTFEARAAASHCEVVATFSRGCFAVAYDPKSGTPGAGWGVGPDQATAYSKAIAMCKATAGPGREGFCEVKSAGCDTSGPAGAKAAPETVPEETQPDDWGPPRDRFRKTGPSGSGWDIPPGVLLLLGVGLAGIAYILWQVLKGKTASLGPAPASPSKRKAPAGRSAKAKAKRTSR
jgi:hypothetical protein